MILSTNAMILRTIMTNRSAIASFVDMIATFLRTITPILRKI